MAQPAWCRKTLQTPGCFIEACNLDMTRQNFVGRLAQQGWKHAIQDIWLWDHDLCYAVSEVAAGTTAM